MVRPLGIDVDNDAGGNVRISVIGGVSCHTVIAPYQVEGARPFQVAEYVAQRIVQCLELWEEKNNGWCPNLKAKAG